jgi:hypothetical protein
VYANTSTNFGPQAKARGWVENIFGRELEAGEQVGIEDLVGGKHHLMLENVLGLIPYYRYFVVNGHRGRVLYPKTPNQAALLAPAVGASRRTPSSIDQA